MENDDFHKQFAPMQSIPNSVSSFPHFQAPINCNFIPPLVQNSNQSISRVPLNNDFRMPPIMCNQVQQQMIPAPIGIKPEASIFIKNHLQPPPVKFTLDPNGRSIGIRCPCKDGTNKGFLLRCTRCGYFVHGKCVGLAHSNPNNKYICPYCDDKTLKCNCNMNEKFDEPLIKCTKCHNWVHKSCAGFTFGHNPAGFLCYACGNPTYHLPTPKFASNSQCLNKSIILDHQKREEIINGLPPGDFKEALIEDLNDTQFSFRDFMIRYINEFAPCLFEYSREFWKTFTSTLSVILNCEKIDILNAIDELIFDIMYSTKISIIPDSISSQNSDLHDLQIADSIQSNVESENLTKFDHIPKPISLYLNDNNCVCTSQSLENNSFICELFGYLCHEDEINASEGIPQNCIIIPNTKVVVEISNDNSHHLPNSLNKQSESNEGTTQKNLVDRNENVIINHSIDSLLISPQNNSSNKITSEIGKNTITSKSFVKNDHSIDSLLISPQNASTNRIEIPKNTITSKSFVKHDHEVKHHFTHIDINRKTNVINKESCGIDCYANRIRRSFDFNCIVKLFRVHGQVHAGLFAIRPKGPMYEERQKDQQLKGIIDDNDTADMMKKGLVAIPKGCELFLPIDADIPYRILMPIWKEKKTRAGNKIHAKYGSSNDSFEEEVIIVRKRKGNKRKDEDDSQDLFKNKNENKKKIVKNETKIMKTRARTEFPFVLTLLSAFLEDACPPLPIILKNQKEIEEENPDPSSIRARLRNPHHKRIVAE